MDKLEKFKEFIKDKEFLIDKVNNKETTWQNLYEIYDYFKSSDTDNIDIAIEELGGEYTEEEIRLVRVKFISEVGN